MNEVLKACMLVRLLCTCVAHHSCLADTAGVTAASSDVRLHRLRHAASPPIGCSIWRTLQRHPRVAVQILEEDPSCGGALAMLADVCAARAHAAAQQQATLHYLLTSTFVRTSAVYLPPVFHWHQHHGLLCT